MSLPRFLEPKLRLFLSADLVGSTALKQRPRNPFEKPQSNDGLAQLSAPWIDPLARFYRGVERHLLDRWETYCHVEAPKLGWPTGDAPEFWKSIGDEVVYVKRLADPREALACLLVWVAALRKYRASLTSPERDTNLDVKSGAWLAGFPLTNTEAAVAAQPTRISADERSKELHLERSSEQLLHYHRLERLYEDEDAGREFVKEYLGPSIDTGFRVASKATPRKLTLTVDLALLLAKVKRPTEQEREGVTDSIFEPDCRLRYENRVELKGVIGNKPYPLFWLDTMSDDKHLEMEDDLLNMDRSPNEDKIASFCDAFVGKNKTYITRPFIHGPSGFGVVPEHCDSRLEQLAQSYRREHQRATNNLVESLEAVGRGADAEGQPRDPAEMSLAGLTTAANG